MLRDAILRRLLRHYAHYIPARRATVGLTVAHILQSLYQTDERRFREKADEYMATIGRLGLLIIELEGRGKP